MSRNFSFSIDEFYHLYNRGNDKRDIFLDYLDRERFLKLLYLCNGKNEFHIQKILDEELFYFNRGESIVDIGAYCLMDNHYHLLVKEKMENGISLFMQRLSTAYSMYFNKKHDRTGALFAGRFKAKHLDDDDYLKYIFAYIHLNPIKIVDDFSWKSGIVNDLEKIKKHLSDYRYSSYQDYLEINRAETRILNKESFPEYFDDVEDFKNYLDDWINYRREELVEVEPRPTKGHSINSRGSTSTRVLSLIR
ncbi:MAG: transposase [Candidatus Paceibacterota bacterium]